MRSIIQGISHSLCWQRVQQRVAPGCCTARLAAAGLPGVDERSTAAVLSALFRDGQGYHAGRPTRVFCGSMCVSPATRCTSAPCGLWYRVFVGGMPFGYEEEAIREYWGECGGVEALDIMRFPDTGRFKGMVFITFATQEAYVNALAADGSDLDGQTLRVRRSNVSQPLSHSPFLCNLRKQPGLAWPHARPGRVLSRRSPVSPP